jgi:hypothetical protein
MKGMTAATLLLIVLVLIGWGVAGWLWWGYKTEDPWPVNQKIEYLEKFNADLRGKNKRLALEMDSLKRYAEMNFQKAELATHQLKHYKKLYENEKAKLNSFTNDEHIEFFGKWTIEAINKD